MRPALGVLTHDGPTGLFKPARFGKHPSAPRLSLFLVAAWFMTISLYEMKGLDFCGPIQEAGGEFLHAA